MKDIFLTIIVVISIGYFASATCECYTGASIGGTLLKINDMSKMSFHMKDDAPALNLCHGYNIPDHPFRLEQQFSISKHYFDSGVYLGTDRLKKDIPLYSYSIVENVFLDIAFERFTPYVGLGIGYHSSTGKFVDYMYGATPHNRFVRIKRLIYQCTLGVKSEISYYSDIFLEYRRKFCRNGSLKENGIYMGLRRSL